MLCDTFEHRDRRREQRGIFLDSFATTQLQTGTHALLVIYLYAMSTLVGIFPSYLLVSETSNR